MAASFLFSVIWINRWLALGDHVPTGLWGDGKGPTSHSLHSNACTNKRVSNTNSQNMWIGERHTDQPIAVFSSPAHPSSGLYSQNLHRFPLHVQLGALLEQFYIEYQKYSEIALVFAFFRYVIGPENSRYFLNQSDSKPKPIPTWSLTVSRAFQGWKEDLPRNVSFSP